MHCVFLLLYIFFLNAYRWLIFIQPIENLILKIYFKNIEKNTLLKINNIKKWGLIMVHEVLIKMTKCGGRKIITIWSIHHTQTQSIERIYYKEMAMHGLSSSNHN